MRNTEYREDYRESNVEGYSDPTAGAAIGNVDPSRNEQRRFDKFMSAIFALCKGFGYHLEDRVVVKDMKNGRVWK